jgi:hypothetical protein
MYMWKTIITLLSILAVVGLLVLFSLRGGGATIPPQPSRIVSIGFQQDSRVAERVAFNRLSQEVASHLTARFVEIRWVNSVFFGFTSAHQWALDYDRQTKELAEYQLEQGPLQRWYGVSEPLLHSLTNSGFDAQLLVRAGCHSDLP